MGIDFIMTRFDITDYLQASNEIIVFVFDPSDSGTQPFG
jgi:hypothetical protein